MTREEKWVLEEKYGGVATAGFEEDKRRLACGEPAAYVIGWQPFSGLKIYLDSHPLIPRPETEWWVEQLAGTMSKWSGPTQTGDPRTLGKDARELRFLDLCAGSGAIGCAILKTFPNAHVSFGEIDPAHEATIRKNIEMNDLRGLSSEIRSGDLFAPFKGECFDYIAINPPYVPAGRELPASVAEHEPALALYSGADGLELLRRLAHELRAHLAPGGQAWIECDSAHAEAARSLFAAAGFSASIRADQFGAPRVIVVS